MRAIVGISLIVLAAGIAQGQTNQVAGNAGEGGLSPATTNVYLWTSTGLTIRVQGGGVQPLAAGSTMTIPKGGGRETRITSTPGGGLTIREPGNNNLTTVTPTRDGGLTIRGANNESIYLDRMLDGSVRMRGIRRSDRTRAVVSRDGESVTIWTRDGTYTVPIPGAQAPMPQPQVQTAGGGGIPYAAPAPTAPPLRPAPPASSSTLSFDDVLAALADDEAAAAELAVDAPVDAAGEEPIDQVAEAVADVEALPLEGELEAVEPDVADVRVEEPALDVADVAAPAAGVLDAPVPASAPDEPAAEEPAAEVAVDAAGREPASPPKRILSFQQSDLDADGCVTLGELDQNPVFDSLGEKRSAMVTAVFNRIDADRDGCLSSEEFERLSNPSGR